MRLNHLSVGAFAALALISSGMAGCATPGIGPAPPGAAEPALTPLKAMTAAELAFRTATTAINRATTAGLLKGDAAAQASVILANAHGALVAARAAYGIGDGIGAIAAASQVTALTAEVRRIAGDS